MVHIPLVLAAVDPVEFAYSQFTGYGLIGAIAMILAFVLWKKEKEKVTMIREWDAERVRINEARMTDFRDLMNRERDNNLVQEKLAVAMSERNSAVNNLTAAIQQQSEVVKSLTQSFNRFENIAERAWDSNRELREELVKGGLRPG